MNKIYKNIEETIVDTVPTDCFTLSKLMKFSGYDAFLVGGCVRDLMLGKEPKDYDFATNANTLQIKEVLKKNNIFYTNVGEQYGTIVAHIGGEEYEITSFRRDIGYSDGRHPSKIEQADNIYDDLKRRDFTINAIAYSLLEGKLYDPFHGKEDLENRILKCVGNPFDRFSEDGLRILRAVRFAAKYDLSFDKDTFLAMEENKDVLDYVSKERITDEFRKMFESDCKLGYVFDKCNFVITKAIPELRLELGCSQINKYHHQDVWHHSLSVLDGVSEANNKFVVKLSALLHDIGKPICKTVDKNGFEHFYGHPEKSYGITKHILERHLVLTSKEKDAVLELVRYHDEVLAPTEKSVNKFIVKHGKDLFDDFLALKQADIDDHVIPQPISEYFSFNRNEVKDVYNLLQEKEACFGLKDMVVKGNDLIEAGIPEGPAIGKTLKFLLDGICDGRYPNKKEVLLNEAKSCYFLKDNDCEEDLEY